MSWAEPDIGNQVHVKGYFYECHVRDPSKVCLANTIDWLKITSSRMTLGVEGENSCLGIFYRFNDIQNNNHHNSRLECYDTSYLAKSLGKRNNLTGKIFVA